MMKHLKISQTQGVSTIALNRPEKRNAFFPEMIREITEAFTQNAQDPTLRAVVLSAEGPSFCSGGDLEWMKSMAAFSYEENVRDAEQLFAMFWSIRSCPVPVLGRVFGHAFGGGAGLVATCDVVAAEASTQFCFSEVKWGLAPAVISPFVVEKVPPAKLAEWFYSAKVFTSPEAQGGGLITFNGSRAEVDEYLARTLELIQQAGPEAVRESKKLLRAYSPIDWPRMRAQAIQLIAERRVSAEGQRGLKAFLDKKSPQWSDPIDARKKT